MTLDIPWRRLAEPGRGRPAGVVQGWRQALVLAYGTWRLAWREPLTRLLGAAAAALALIGAVAAIGSPTPGQGAIQMLAVCLQVVPFAVVLLAGDIWRRDADEAGVWARPVDALAYTFGRALGLALVGLALLGGVALIASVGLWAVAGLALGRDLLWDGLFAAVYVAPGLVLLIGVCFWWLARGAVGPRYHAAVILGALLLAFYDYKLDLLAERLRALAFLAPFPGFLTLGLAMPPALLGAPWVPGWLWLNRAFFTLLGLALLGAAARRRAAGLHRLPLRAPRRLEQALAAVLLLAALTAGALLGLVPHLAPAMARAWPPLQLPAPAVRQLDLAVILDPATGRVAGRALWRLERAGACQGPQAPRSCAFAVLLNGGLALRPPAGTQVEPLEKGLLPGTAARLYRLQVPARLLTGGALPLRFAGRLLPVPSTLPYPPFAVGQTYEGAAVGDGRVFLDGRGSWYPVLVAAGGRPVPPGAVRLQLQLVGPGRGLRWLGLPARAQPTGLAVLWQGSALPPVIGALAPYGAYVGRGWRLWARRQPNAAERAVLRTYARAERRLAQAGGPWPVGPLPVVAMPLLTHPLWADGRLWLPDNEPFCVPPDPVAGGCGPGAAPPSLEQAVLLLARLRGLRQGNLPGGNLVLPAPLGSSRAETAWPPAAAVAAWRALGDDPAVAAAWTGGAVLPWIGPLSAAQRLEAARWAQAPGAVLGG